MLPQGELALFFKQTGIEPDMLIMVETDSSADVNYRLAPDGTMIVRNELGGGPRVIRPPNSHERARRQLEYWQRRLETVRAAFVGLKGAISDPRRSAWTWPDRDLGPSSGDPLADLRMLRDRHRIIKRMVVMKTVLLETEPEEVRRRKAVEMREQAQRQANDRFAEVAARARGITLESEIED